MNTFGKRLKLILKEKEKTQEWLANEIELGGGQGTVARWLRDTEPTEPKAETIRKICKVLNVSSDYLLGLEDSKENKNIQYIMEYTGLSEKAIKKVMEINKLCLSENQPNFLDNLLTNKYCTELFYYLCEYLKKPKNDKMNFKNIVQFHNDNSDDMAIIEYEQEFPCKFVKGYYLSELSKILALIDEELNNTNLNFYNKILNTVEERAKNGNDTKKK